MGLLEIGFFIKLNTFFISSVTLLLHRGELKLASNQDSQTTVELVTLPLTQDKRKTLKIYATPVVTRRPDKPFPGYFRRLTFTGNIFIP